jgi:hypothetical protein
MKLLHDESYFNERSVKEKAINNGFSDNLSVELFLWDCEIAAQLQSFSHDLVLKGGAAVQLHLPVEKQRASIDIDLIGPLTEEEVKEIVSKIPSTLPDISFNKYSPKSPNPRMPLITYTAKISSFVSERRVEGIQLKIEFLLEDLKLENHILPAAETFALTTKNLKAYTPRSLIGDKLLTLAENTIGIQKKDDIPKQIYDVATLGEAYINSSQDFSQIVKTVETLVPVEAAYRELECESLEVLNDIQSSLDKYCLLGTKWEDRTLWGVINSFQYFYINSSQRKDKDGWSEIAWRLKFLSELISSIIKSQSVTNQAELYSSAINISKKMNDIQGTKIREVKFKLIKFIEQRGTYHDELRGKSLQRIFWQAVNSENIQSIQELISDYDKV